MVVDYGSGYLTINHPLACVIHQWLLQLCHLRNSYHRGGSRHCRMCAGQEQDSDHLLQYYSYHLELYIDR